MPTTFRRERKTITVSPANPLPVTLTQTDSVPTQPTSIDTLLYGNIIPSTGDTSTPDGRIDLWGSTDGETPTISNAFAYKRFIITGWTSYTTNPITFALWARSTDPSGAPLHTSGTAVWFKIGDFTATFSNGYFRAVLAFADGTPLGFDAYRITVHQTGTPASTYLVLRGER